MIVSVEETVEQFISAINGRSVDTITNLLTEDHLFVDSLGEWIEGREDMRQGWLGYFALVPDYRIEVSEMIVRGDVVAIFGMASGTYSSGGPLRDENRWSTPGAWRAVVRDGKIKEWLVFADNEPVRRIMRREEGSR
jgi:ketosteroid isomerase-like protein